MYTIEQLITTVYIFSISVLLHIHMTVIFLIVKPQRFLYVSHG